MPIDGWYIGGYPQAGHMPGIMPGAMPPGHGGMLGMPPIGGKPGMSWYTSKPSCIGCGSARCCSDLVREEPCEVLAFTYCGSIDGRALGFLSA
jgi:hypothetical protein